MTLFKSCLGSRRASRLGVLIGLIAWACVSEAQGALAAWARPPLGAASAEWLPAPSPSPFPSPGVNRDPAWPFNNDVDVEENVQNTLAEDPFLFSGGIDVVVQHGDVILTGTVNTLAQRERAEADAYAAGARRVDNWLQVAFP